MSDLPPPYPPYQPPGDEPQPPYGEQPAPPYGQPYEQPYPAAPYSAYGAQPTYGPGGPPLYGYGQSHGGANTAMVLGIISVVAAVLNLFCCVTGIISLGLGPVAIWMGVKARGEIDAQPAAYTNRGAAVAGFVTGIVGTVLGALTLAFFVLFFGFALTAG